MDVCEMRMRLGDTQKAFAERYGIPFRTIQNWETGLRTPPKYILSLLESRVRADLANRRAVRLPAYDPHKIDLPKRGDYIGATAWLKAVSAKIDEPVVFALDEALMCGGSFGGHSDEYIVWLYGSPGLSRFNGVVVLGTQIDPTAVREKNGLRYTSFDRTLADAISNAHLLDMQGITEALGKHYYANGESFADLSVVPEQQDDFKRLAAEAVEYYES